MLSDFLSLLIGTLKNVFQGLYVMNQYNLVIAKSNEKFEKASHVVPGTVYPFLRGVGLTALRIGSNPIMGICQNDRKTIHKNQANRTKSRLYTRCGE